MFIEDRITAATAGWRRVVDVESTEHGAAMLSLLSLSYRPSELCLGVGILQELAWYAHDIPALVTTLVAEIGIYAAIIAAPALGCLTG